MEFDMNTIQHLGISMYSRLPPVLAELVANCWDADANEVTIELFDEDLSDKKILVKDNGYGMNLDDINEKFLQIGRNRRISENTDKTPGGRKVIGRKGIGKLSIFGIAEEVIITTVRNSLKNQFRLSLPDIKKSGNKYFPDHYIDDEKTNEKEKTYVELRKIKRKSKFNVDSILMDLARRFLIFDKNFRVSVIYNNDIDNNVLIENELRFKNLDIEFKWKIPHEVIKSDYEHKDKVIGEIYTSKKICSYINERNISCCKGKTRSR
jgi:hypothetical protein